MGESDLFRIETLGRGIHAALARAGGEALSNSMIVDLGDATVAFDAMLTPRAGAALARAARRLTGRSPDFLIDSHWHGDHVWGAGAMAPLRVIASRRTRELLKRKSAEQYVSGRRAFRRELALLDGPRSTVPIAEREFFRGWFEGVLGMPARFAVRLPDLTFESEMVLHGSRRELRIATFGGGHSPSDVIAHLPDEGVVSAGDLVVTDMHPSLSDGFPEEWLRILHRLGSIRADRIVPGHGRLGNREDLALVGRYLRDVRGLAAVANRTGQLAGSVAVPERYARWSGQSFFASNLARAQRLLRRSR